MRSGFIIFTILLFSNHILGQGSFGPPSNPTYGNVQSDIPQGYYQEADGTSGEDLKEGQIYNSNLYVFKELAERAGAQIIKRDVIL